MKNKILNFLVLSLFFTTINCVVAEESVKPNADTLALCENLIDLSSSFDSKQKEADTKARIALRKLSNQVTQNNADNNLRLSHSLALLNALKKTDNFSKGLTIVMELQLVGKDEAIPQLIGLLQHQRLYKPAARALVNIHIEKKSKLIKNAFDDKLLSASPETLITFIKACSSIRSQNPEVIKKLNEISSSHADKIVQIISYEALANIGHPSSSDTMIKALDQFKGYDLGKLYTLNHLYIRRLAEQDKPKALKICQTVINKATTIQNQQGFSFLIGSLSALYDINGAQATTQLLPYLTDENIKLRVGVIRILSNSPPNKEVAQQLLAQLDSSNSTQKLALFDILIVHEKEAVTPYIIKSLLSNDKALKLAMPSYLLKLDEKKYMPTLVDQFVIKGDHDKWTIAFPIFESLKNTQSLNSVIDFYDTTESEELKTLILKLIGKRSLKEHSAVALKAFKKGSPTIKTLAINTLSTTATVKDIESLIAIMTSESTTKSERRLLQNAIVSAITLSAEPQIGIQKITNLLTTAEKQSQAPLFNILGRCGDNKGLELLVTYTTEKHDARIQQEAVKSLALSPHFFAVKCLAKVVQSSNNDIVKILCINGIVKNILNNKTVPIQEARNILEEVLKHASRDEDKARIKQLLENKKLNLNKK